MKTAIVTGSNGFIGRFLTKALLQRDYYVYGIDVASAALFNDNNFKYLQMNSKQYDIEKNYFSEKNIDLFFHFGWNSTSGEGRKDFKTQISNIESSCDNLELCKDINAKRFIYASSIMEYEDLYAFAHNINNPNLLYSCAKYSAHEMTRLIAAENSIDYCAVCISNIFGPGEKSKRFINTLIRNMLNNVSMELSSGTQQYDFIYIEDAVDAIITVAEKGKLKNEYYIGTNDNLSLKDYVKRVSKIVNPEYKLEFKNDAKISLDYSIFDRKAIYDELGFKCKVGFDKGVKISKDYILATERNASINAK